MVIRKMEVSDAGRFLDMLRKLDTETKFMMYEPGERKTTLGEMQDRIKSFNEENSLLLAAVVGEEIVGFLTAERGFANRVKHSAYIVAGILSGHQGKGIGKSLFAALDKWAESSGITRLELTVMKHNESAVSLYKKMGFVIEGEKPNSLIVDGQYIDEYYMAKLFSERNHE